MRPRRDRVRGGVVTGLLCLALVVAAPLAAGATATAPVSVPLVGAGDPDVTSTTYSTALTQPLVVVVDLSSSMLEDDGTGTVKLDGAKVALSSLMRRQPGGAQIGLWTYPSPTDACGPGGYVPGAAVGPVTDPSTLSAMINALEAEGDTPTGPALTAVVDSLRVSEITHATILLVSDGESNCDTPPCEVAQQIAADGFDITVEAMGFQISEAGREELECIAAATDGHYYDVQDSSQLAEMLDEIAVPRLALDVTASSTVTAGMATTIRAEVSNSSAQPTEDVAVSLVFTDAGSSTIFPAVVPSRFRLGNIPGRSTVVREWTISAAGAAANTASWRVTAWATGVGAISQTGSIEVREGQGTLADAGPVLQGLSSGPVVILGDSYSSGEGAGTYLPGTDDTNTLCHRSSLTYGVSLFSASRSEIVACSGAVAEHIVSPKWDSHADAQLHQVAALAEPPSLVLMTIGGNDIGFGNIIKRCVYSGVGYVPSWGDCSDDSAFVASSFRSIATLGPTLERSYRAVWDAVNTPALVAARDGAVAPVVVLAYPQVLPQWQRGSCEGFEADEIKFGNAIVAELDAAAARSVAAVQRAGYSVYFAGDVHDAVLPEHTACGREPYINPLSQLAGYVSATGSGKTQELMHPNGSGYAAMTNALLAWSQSAEPVSAPVPVAAPVRTSRAQTPKVTVDMSPAAAGATVRVQAGQAVDVTISGLVPGTSVTVAVHSTPRALGSFDVGADGTARGVVYVPLDLGAGKHRLSAAGLGEGLGVVEYSTGLTVLPERPVWFWPLLGLCVAFTVGGVILLGRARRLLSATALSAPTTTGEPTPM